MATCTKEELDLFIEHNENCDTADLLEWIAELLPQDDFNSYIENIKDELLMDKIDKEVNL